MWPINQWVHVVCVSNSLALTIYINGVASVTGTGSGSPSTNPSYIGKWYNFTSSATYLNGRVDEERVSNTARSAGWIATEYNNQSSPSSFFSVGAQQTNGGNTGGNPQLTLILPTPLPNAFIGQFYSTHLISEYLDPIGGTAPYSVYAQTVLPPGLSLTYNNDGGILSGIIPAGTTAGNYGFTVEVNDFSGYYSGTISMNLTIGSTSSIFSITTLSLPNGTFGSNYAGAVSAHGGTAPYSWSISSGSPPPGLTLPGTTSGLGNTLGGTPAQTGTYTFTIQVTDSTGLVATHGYIVTISPGLVVSPTSLPSIEQNISYNQTFSASDGTSPYTFSVPPNSLPPGLTLSSSGVLSGTPTTTGTFSFSLTVRDSNGVVGTDSLSLTVVGAVTIATNSLPSATSGVAYSASLTPSGGTPSYTWSITSGTLPSGLTLSANGTLSGTTSSTGSFNITIKVQDGDGASASKTFTLTIASSSSPPTVTCSGTPTSPAPGQQVTFTASGSGGTGALTYTWSAPIDATGQTITVAAPSTSSFSATVTATDSTPLTSSPATCSVSVQLPTVREYIRIGNRIIAVEVHQ